MNLYPLTDSPRGQRRKRSHHHRQQQQWQTQPINAEQVVDPDRADPGDALDQLHHPLPRSSCRRVEARPDQPRQGEGHSHPGRGTDTYNTILQTEPGRHTYQQHTRKWREPEEGQPGQPIRRRQHVVGEIHGLIPDVQKEQGQDQRPAKEVHNIILSLTRL